MNKKVTLYFVRHGETYFNQYGRMQGWSDTPLTERGIAVARKTGERLKNVCFERIVASDLGRTIKTAGIILAESECNQGKAVEQNAAFRESFFGYFEGSDSKTTYAELAGKLGIAPQDIFGLGLEKISAAFKEYDPYHDAEDYSESLTRMKCGLKELVAEVSQTASSQSECNVLVVTHGNVIRTLVHDIEPEMTVTVEIHNASVTTIVFEADQFILESFNQI